MENCTEQFLELVQEIPKADTPELRAKVKRKLSEALAGRNGRVPLETAGEMLRFNVAFEPELRVTHLAVREELEKASPPLRI